MIAELINMGGHNKGYQGAFTPVLDSVIKSVLFGRVLHLFSGASLIGQVRIDKAQPNATINCDVLDFLGVDENDWDWILLDPPYAIVSADKKLRDYADHTSVFANVPLRRAIKRYAQLHADNVLWLDICAPTIAGFNREKLWLCLPGGFHTVRVLSWLKKNMQPLL